MHSDVTHQPMNSSEKKFINQFADRSLSLFLVSLTEKNSIYKEKISTSIYNEVKVEENFLKLS